MATLRAAAPHQTARAAAADDGSAGDGGAGDGGAGDGGAGGPAFRIAARDLHIRRFAQTTDRVLIFAVDASGSAAAARLAEAKGAVELLLAEAYRRRDHVALVSFRGAEAALVLPPTRSLTATKARLRGLPGGGATPLAAGLRVALDTAARARAAGLVPALALLTDGRGNIALDGRTDRTAATEDALRLARALRAAGVPGVVLDTGLRPHAALPALAAAMDAAYLALPRADARGIARAVGQNLHGVAHVAR